MHTPTYIHFAVPPRVMPAFVRLFYNCTSTPKNRVCYLFMRALRGIKSFSLHFDALFTEHRATTTRQF